MEHTPSTPTSRQQFKLLRQYSEALGMKKAPVIASEKKMVAESNHFFDKWEVMRNWFESD